MGRIKLLELSPVVNFINILHEIFWNRSALYSFSLVMFWLCNFWCKNIGTKVVCKMLMKLTPGADATNISGLLNPKKLGNFKN